MFKLLRGFTTGVSLWASITELLRGTTLKIKKQEGGGAKDNGVELANAKKRRENFSEGSLVRTVS